MKDPKVQAFLSAFQALFTNEDNDDNEDNNEKEYRNNVDDKEDDGNNHNEGDDLHCFLLMIGLLKE